MMQHCAVSCRSRHVCRDTIGHRPSCTSGKEIPSFPSQILSGSKKMIATNTLETSRRCKTWGFPISRIWSLLKLYSLRNNRLLLSSSCVLLHVHLNVQILQEWEACCLFLITVQKGLQVLSLRLHYIQGVATFWWTLIKACVPIVVCLAMRSPLKETTETHRHEKIIA